MEEDVYKFTLEDYEVLQFASRMCMCESYYSYICHKCKKSASGFLRPKDASIERLFKMNLVCWKYGGLSLSDSGKYKFSELEKTMKTHV